MQLTIELNVNNANLCTVTSMFEEVLSLLRRDCRNGIGTYHEPWHTDVKDTFADIVASERGGKSNVFISQVDIDALEKFSLWCDKLRNGPYFPMGNLGYTCCQSIHDQWTAAVVASVQALIAPPPQASKPPTLAGSLAAIKQAFPQQSIQPPPQALPKVRYAGPVHCSRCNEKNDHAVPNQPDGSFKCYVCRQPGVY